MVITPSVGRKVWFYQSVTDAQNPSVQPRDATVVYVISDRLVNLRVSDTKGDQTPKLAVQLYQEGDEDPQGEFACWMPYQSQQAKKDREGEKAAIQSGFDVLTKRLEALEKEVLLLKPNKEPSPPASIGLPPALVQPIPEAVKVAAQVSQVSKPPVQQVTK